MSEETKTPPSQLCPACGLFYGSVATSGMCSKCFKSQPSPPPLPADSFPVPAAIQQEEAKAQSEGHSVMKCKVCPRGLGLIPFACRCGFSFCTDHRVPEKHACTFDFQSQGRRKLSESNPLVAAEKVTKI